MMRMFINICNNIILYIKDLIVIFRNILFILFHPHKPQKNNIMFLIDDLHNGGAQRVISNLCNNLKDEYNITVVLSKNNPNDYVTNVDVIYIGNLSKGIRRLNGLTCLARLKIEKHVCTTISFLVSSNFNNVFTKLKDKVIISNRNYLSCYKKISRYKHKKILGLILKISMQRADLVVNVSKSVQKDCIDNFKINPNKLITIYNFWDPDIIHKQKLEKLTNDEKIMFRGNTLICNGRLVYQKGQWHLIRAFKKVVKKIPNATLILTGRGELEEYYYKLIKDLKLEKNVYILGFVNNVYKYTYNANIFVLPSSFFEGMSNAIIEAMACEKPIIATDVPGGNKELLSLNNKLDEYTNIQLNAEYGILIPPCDEIQTNGIIYNAELPLTREENILACSIIQLLNDKKLQSYYTKQSKKRSDLLKKDKILKQWKKILK